MGITPVIIQQACWNQIYIPLLQSDFPAAQGEGSGTFRYEIDPGIGRAYLFHIPGIIHLGQTGICHLQAERFPQLKRPWI